MKHIKLIIPTILIISLISIIVFTKSTKFSTIEVVEEPVEPLTSSTMAIYIQNDDNTYTSTNTFPTTGYVLNETNSYCEVDGVTDTNTTIAYSSGTATISINSTNTLCYIYLDIE